MFLSGIFGRFRESNKLNRVQRSKTQKVENFSRNWKFLRRQVFWRNRRLCQRSWRENRKMFMKSDTKFKTRNKIEFLIVFALIIMSHNCFYFLFPQTSNFVSDQSRPSSLFSVFSPFVSTEQCLGSVFLRTLIAVMPVLKYAMYWGLKKSLNIKNSIKFQILPDDFGMFGNLLKCFRVFHIERDRWICSCLSS